MNDNRKNYQKFFLILMLLCTAASRAELPYAVYVPAELKQGNAYFIECVNIPEGSTFQIEYSDGTKSPRFPLVRFQSGNDKLLKKQKPVDILAFPVGIHPLAAPGKAGVKVLAHNGSVVFTAKTVITPVQWEKEVIPLNSTLTNLITKPDPAKEAQAKRYQEILAAINLDRVFLVKPLQLPVAKPRITSEFGVQRHYIYANGTKSISFHAGIDFGKEEDTTIYAAGAGRVVLAEDRIVTGKTVVIEHLPGVYSIYMHMDALNVALYDNVTAGMPIGIMGSTGLATGTHLHWELRICTVPVDPRSLVYIDFFSKLHTIEGTQEGGDFN